jgi:hypothetical protein
MWKLVTAPALALGLLAGTADAQSGVRIGILECTMTDSRNLVIRSTKDFDCIFRPNSDNPETYRGRMSRTGLDLTVRGAFKIVWGVLAATENAYTTGALRGTFVGGSADVALGAGIGTNILVGGSGNLFTLQPLSITGTTGAGLSLTLTRFVLE